MEDKVFINNAFEKAFNTYIDNVDKDNSLEFSA